MTGSFVTTDALSAVVLPFVVLDFFLRPCTSMILFRFASPMHQSSDLQQVRVLVSSVFDLISELISFHCYNIVFEYFQFLGCGVRTRYCTRWICLLPRLVREKKMVFSITICDHRICISLGLVIRTDTGCADHVVGAKYRYNSKTTTTTTTKTTTELIAAVFSSGLLFSSPRTVVHPENSLFPRFHFPPFFPLIQGKRRHFGWRQTISSPGRPCTTLTQVYDPFRPLSSHFQSLSL